MKPKKWEGGGGDKKTQKEMSKNGAEKKTDKKKDNLIKFSNQLLYDRCRRQLPF